MHGGYLTDHAIVRYLERAKGFNIAKIRQEMLTPTTIEAIEAGAVTVKISGVDFIVKDKTIVTVLDRPCGGGSRKLKKRAQKNRGSR